MSFWSVYFKFHSNLVSVLSIFRSPWLEALSLVSFVGLVFLYVLVFFPSFSMKALFLTFYIYIKKSIRWWVMIFLIFDTLTGTLNTYLCAWKLETSTKFNKWTITLHETQKKWNDTANVQTRELLLSIPWWIAFSFKPINLYMLRI